VKKSCKKLILLKLFISTPVLMFGAKNVAGEEFMIFRFLSKMI